MRKINEIIVHCTATPEDKDFSVADIDRWHRARGFDGIGYHYVVCRDGSVHKGRDVAKSGAHCKGHNAGSIGVCYVGGMTADGKTPKDTRTEAQRAALRALVERLRREHPGASVHGHNEYSSKACPCFNVQTEL